ncbi:2-dehydropantoate 2-reductase [Brevibacillus sp. SYP-B805]|uniref:ketopantoate reductase family protein n=1 Tax=Brevibacillus sp. SYP-B805 TaxID=1578199 RepID=UPI0013EA8A83|nr:2-dehydropantoate 2-reductase [Brevibacillus sp. SYP-B805]NGQ93701.1 2-dehydropantoate 2-reductase [Brevibacillus sp. SYP-B805]
MRIVIIGGGSVGLLLAARLKLGGAWVHVVTRSAEQADRLQKEGLLLHRLDGSSMPVPMEASPASSPLPEADLYLLAVKQTDLADLLPALSRIAGSARVLALQNGMGHGERLAEVIAPDQLYLGVNTEGARRLSPVAVEHTGTGVLRIGPWRSRKEKDDLVERFVELLRRSGIAAEYWEEIGVVLWRKLLINALINPLTALFEVPNGFLLQVPDILQMMRQLFDEASAVANRAGQKIPEESWQEILTICRNTSRNTSSMLQDLRSGKQTEIEAINGYIVNTGKKYGISTPKHETLRQLIRLKEQMRPKG